MHHASNQTAHRYTAPWVKATPDVRRSFFNRLIASLSDGECDHYLWERREARHVHTRAVRRHETP